MATVLTTAEIPPGGEGKIEVKVATGGRRGDLLQNVNVVSNDPETPTLTLSVKGKIEVLAGFEPDRLNIGQIKMGEKKQLEVRLAGSKADALRQGEFTSSQPDFLQARRDAGDPLKVLVDVTAPRKEGTFSGQLSLKTGLPAPAEIMLMIFGQVTGDIVADRQFIYLQPLPGGVRGVPALLAEIASGAGGDRVFRLRLRSLSGKSFRITAIEDAERVVAGSVTNRGLESEVILWALRQPANPNGVVRLHTDQEDQKTIDIRYLVRAAGSGENVPLFDTRRPLVRPIPQVRQLQDRIKLKPVEAPPPK